MGRDKATIRMGDKMLIKHVYDVAAPLFEQIMVVSSYHEAIEGVNAPFFKDILPCKGTIVGIVSALLYARTPYVFVLACDMPFVSEEAIRYVIGEGRGEDVVIPRTKGGLEPMHAIYSRAGISPMLTAIQCGRFKVRDVLPFLTVRVLSRHDVFCKEGVSTFLNVNTEEDLEVAKRIL